ncbi:MAG: DUF1540 domain-containing protein [Candidatus Margulisbacteria bacterium]|nr:DUF1540 domain-containing protein [Candidatus Margulisiibacteriota bacterium]
MKNKLVCITDCEVTECAYNKEKMCCTPAITIGDGDCPMCDTSFITKNKGGFDDVSGSVGACKVGSCAYNSAFECIAPGIHVQMHKKHAECGTYMAR